MAINRSGTPSAMMCAYIARSLRPIAIIAAGPMVGTGLLSLLSLILIGNARSSVLAHLGARASAVPALRGSIDKDSAIHRANGQVSGTKQSLASAFLTDHIVQSFSTRRMHKKTVTMSHLVAVDKVPSHTL
jgi:hypothetical protein